MRLGGTAILVVIVACSGAWADEDRRADARQLADSGMAHYNLSEYKEALHDFKEAYRLHHEPTFLFNIGQCYRQLNDPAAASNFYRAYRRETSDSSHREEVDRLIVEMDRQVVERAKHQPPTGTRLPPDAPDAPPATTTPPPAPTTPAPATAATSAPSSVVAGEDEHRREHRSVARRGWFWGTMAGAAVVVAGAVVLGVVLGSPAHDPVPTSGRIAGN